MKVLGRATWIAAIAGALLATGAVQAQTIDGPNVEWRFSTWGKSRAFTVTAEKLAEILEQRTDGRFKMKVYYGEALSKSREVLDGIRLRAFDAAYFCNFYHPGKNPAFMVLSLPFLPLEDWQTSQAVREAVYAHPAAVADMDRWQAMTFMSTLLPQYEFLGRGEPPHELSDWKGMRVRAGGGVGEAMEKLGATRATVPAPEVYTAVQRGTMDAASFPFTYAHVAYKIHEVSDWYTTNLAPGSADCPMVFSKHSFAQLPPQYRKLIMDSKDALYQAQIKAYEEIDEKNLPMLRKALTPVTYTAEQREKFRSVAGEPVWDEWVAANAGKFDAKSLLQAVFDTAEEVRSSGMSDRVSR